MTLAAKLTDKQKWQRLLSSLRYSLYVIFHPFDGFWDLSREKRGSLGAANIIVFLVLLVRLLSMQFTPFLFMNVYWPSVNIIQQCLAVLLPLLFFVAGNWGLTTLFEGKGTFKDVYIATCYALTPYVILQVAMILLANVITAKEEQKRQEDGETLLDDVHARPVDVHEQERRELHGQQADKQHQKHDDVRRAEAAAFFAAQIPEAIEGVEDNVERIAQGGQQTLPLLLVGQFCCERHALSTSHFILRMCPTTIGTTSSTATMPKIHSMFCSTHSER